MFPLLMAAMARSEPKVAGYALLRVVGLFRYPSSLRFFLLESTLDRKEIRLTIMVRPEPKVVVNELQCMTVLTGFFNKFCQGIL